MIPFYYEKLPALDLTCQKSLWRKGRHRTGVGAALCPCNPEDQLKTNCVSLADRTWPAANVRAVFSCIPLRFIFKLSNLTSLSTTSTWLDIAAIINPDVVESTSGLLGVPVVFTSCIWLGHHLIIFRTLYSPHLSPGAAPHSTWHRPPGAQLSLVTKYQLVVKTCTALHVNTSPSSLNNHLLISLSDKLLLLVVQLLCSNNADCHRLEGEKAGQ